MHAQQKGKEKQTNDKNPRRVLALQAKYRIMSEKNPEILSSSARLQERLYRLRHGSLKPNEELTSPYTYAHSITNIENIIFGIDLEDALYILDYNLEQCTSSLHDLPAILKGYNFSDKFNGWTDGKFIPPTKGSELRKILKETISAELKFYIQQLSRLRTAIQLKFEKQGDKRFSNAGYKITFDLTVPEIGSLFNLLFETQIIKHKEIDGKDLTKKKLAEFISKNFSSTSEESISTKYITNQLSHNDQAAEGSIVEKLDLLIQHADPVNNTKKRRSK